MEIEARRRVIENLRAIIEEMALPVADEIGMKRMLARELIDRLHPFGGFESDLELEVGRIVVPLLRHPIDPTRAW